MDSISMLSFVVNKDRDLHRAYHMYDVTNNGVEDFIPVAYILSVDY